jgi:uncharacterized protein YoaH (UPF0181 family)
MAVRESKMALVEAAALLGTDVQSARIYLRRVQQVAGPVSYATIVKAMQSVGISEVEAVAALASELRHQNTHQSDD